MSGTGQHPADDADRDFIEAALPAFISEAQEQIESLEQLLLQLEDAPGDTELLNALFRCAHTVKGSAGIFGLNRVVAFTHHVETLLDQLREGHLALTPALSTLLLQCNDQLRNLVAQARDRSESEDPQQEALRAGLVAQLQAAAGHLATTPALAQAAPATGAEQDWQLSAAFGRDTFRNGMDPLALLNYLRGLGEIQRLVCDTAAVPTLDQLDPESCHLAFELALHTEATREQIEGAFSFVRDDCELQVRGPGAALQRNDIPTPTPQGLPPGPASPAPSREAGPAHAATATAEEGRFIRVQADRLDEVINLLGELVIASAGASLLARQTRQGALLEANSQIGRLVEEIRNGTLQLRMVPIGETFSRFRRVVRDTAAELGKDVLLDIVGGDTELDKSVVERIADPLMHLVRNALDHGLETPEQRLGSGKPAQGRLQLSACHESGSVLIRIDDDGRGIQRDKVLQRAWERGLVEPGVVPADADIDRLIFEPGFSTAE